MNAAVDRFVARVGHWEPARWAKPSASGPAASGPAASGPAASGPAASGPAASGQRRSDVVHALAQTLADLSRGVEGLPPHPVPRLDNDLALPDQVRVMAADLLLAAAPDDVLRRAADLIDATTRSL